MNEIARRLCETVEDRHPAEAAAFRHFMRLVGAGTHRGASHGELRARALAEAVANNLPGLDDLATQGLICYIAICQRAPETGRGCLYL